MLGAVGALLNLRKYFPRKYKFLKLGKIQMMNKL
jgi:hypothetical protein